MKKTIVFYIATLTRGGAERVMAGLANYFAGQDYRVLLLTLEEEEGLYPLSERIEKRVLSLPEGGSRFGNVLKRILQVRRVLKETKADAMVAFIGKTNIRAILAGLFLPTKVFVSVRSAPVREYPGMQKILARGLFALADGVIFQTEEAGRWFSGAVRQKSRILLNPLSAEYTKGAYTGVREERIVTVGRMDPVKNHALLVKAFAAAVEKHPGLRLEIYGDGECRKEIEGLCRELGIGDRVFLAGDTSRPAEKIWRAGVFVLSSNFEGMPNAVAEAMASGIPVVATDCPSGGARALVKNEETGLLVPVGDEKAMTRAILRVLEEEGLGDRLAERAELFAKSLYPDKIYKMWQNYIEEVCGL